MSQCDSCLEPMGGLTFRELQNRAELPFETIVRKDGSPIGFPVTFCTNPFCETNYGDTLT